MELINLKDASIVKVFDKTNRFDIFTGTFTDDEWVEYTTLEFLLKDTRKITLTTFEGNTYGKPHGLRITEKFLMFIMKAAFEKDLTLVDFIKKIMKEYGEFIQIIVEKNDVKKSGIYALPEVPGVVKNDAAYYFEKITKNKNEYDIIEQLREKFGNELNFEVVFYDEKQDLIINESIKDFLNI